MSSITVIGTLGRDPELKFFNSGKAYCNFSVAETARKKDESGQWVDGDTTWFNCSAYDTMAENVAASLFKGMRVVVIGSQQERAYEKDGETKKIWELRVEEVCPSLRWASAVITKNPSRGSSGGSRTAPAEQAAFSEEPF
jgi:single-strand DNA-binding protein